MNRKLTRTGNLAAGIVLASAVAAGCGDGSVNPPRGPALPMRYQIAPVRTDAGLTGRSVIECPMGRCIVLHYPPCKLDVQQTEVMEQFVARLVTGDTATTEDDGCVQCQEQPRWCPGRDERVVYSTFNCCTFAVGDVLGLTTDDWLMPLACGQTEDTFPMQVVLNSYFEQVRHYAVGVSFDWMRIELDPALRQDDVLCYVQTFQSNGASTQIIHAGRIWKHEGRNWLVSKIGMGPIVMAPIDALAREFGGEIDAVWVHRRKAQID